MLHVAPHLRARACVLFMWQVVECKMPSQTGKHIKTTAPIVFAHVLLAKASHMVNINGVRKFSPLMEVACSQNMGEERRWSCAQIIRSVTDHILETLPLRKGVMYSPITPLKNKEPPIQGVIESTFYSRLLFLKSPPK